MTLYDDLVSRNPDIAKFLHSILDRVRGKACEYLTVPHLCKISGVNAVDVVRFSGYLSDVGLFETRHSLFRDDEDSSEEDNLVLLEPEVVEEARRVGYLIDPYTGEEVVNWENDVVTFYRGTDRLKEALRP